MYTNGPFFASIKKERIFLYVCPIFAKNGSVFAGRVNQAQIFCILSQDRHLPLFVICACVSSGIPHLHFLKIHFAIDS
jgi:hypothetical protein